MKQLLIYPPFGSSLEYKLRHWTDLYEGHSGNEYLYCGRMIPYDKIVSLIDTYRFSEFCLSETKYNYILRVWKE